MTLLEGREVRLPGCVDAAEEKPALLVLASTYPRWPNDVEPAFVHELSRRLCARFRVTVLCPHAPGAAPAEWLDDVEVIRYRYAPARLELLVNEGGIVTNVRNHPWMLLLVPGFVLAQVLGVWRLLRKRRVDVIHAHWLIPQGFICWLIQRLVARKVPYVVTSHGADLYALRRPVLTEIKRRVAQAASAVTVVSSAMKSVVQELAPRAREVRVLPMGVDIVGRFALAPAGVRSDSELLFVGRLVEKKGVEHLIRALPTIVKQRPDVHLTVAGFGPLTTTLMALGAHLGVADRIRFLGAVPQSEVASLYRRAAVFVAPFVQARSGDQEGLPVALMEAVATGCPVVAGRVDGLEDIFGPSLEHWTVDARDHVALATCVVAALDDPLHARSAALLLRSKVSAYLDWNRIAREYGQLLADSVGR